MAEAAAMEEVVVGLVAAVAEIARALGPKEETARFHLEAGITHSVELY